MMIHDHLRSSPKKSGIKGSSSPTEEAKLHLSSLSLLSLQKHLPSSARRCIDLDLSGG
jgi:hypothetical protein